MRSGVAAEHVGYFHEAACYGSDEEFLAIVVPFLEGGLQAGEPTMAAFDEPQEKLLSAAISEPSAVTFLGGSSQYSRPASTIRSYRKVLAEQVAAGAQQIRIAGDMPHPGKGAPWGWWARYEATINRVLDDFPLWGLCTYDTRITPGEVLADVVSTHPWLASPSGEHATNDGYVEPADFLERLFRAGPDPLEAAPPMVDLADPSPAAARHAILGSRLDLDDDEVRDLSIAVNEVVTNARLHGRPPVRLRMWAGSDRAVVAVTDGGPGPADPFAGLVPASGRQIGGLGLWLVHQLCSNVTFSRNGDGFTIRLVAGEPAIDTAGEPAIDTAGEPANDTAGEPANDTAR